MYSVEHMDYYEILGVSKGASEGEIKKAYRNLSKEWHPDKHKGEKAAEEKYKQINRAYEALSDPKKRKMYDQFGSEDGPQFGGGGNPFGGGFNASGFEGFGDMFETFFGGARGRTQARETGGRDMEVEVSIPLEDAFRGTSKVIRLRTLVECSTCKGTGDAPGSKKINCSMCGGTGQVVRRVQSIFGALEQSTICDRCHGSGKVPETPCKECKGEGRIQGSEEITVEVPAGIQTGQTLRVRGRGEAGRQGKNAGDLFVHIHVQADPRFERSGDDLKKEVTIPVTDAVLGSEVSIDTFEGSLTVKIPAGTQPEQILRIKGKGMPVLNSSKKGDLYVTVKVAIPQKVDREERKLWDALRKS